jgi:hypothetical protein
MQKYGFIHEDDGFWEGEGYPEITWMTVEEILIVGTPKDPDDDSELMLCFIAEPGEDIAIYK